MIPASVSQSVARLRCANVAERIDVLVGAEIPGNPGSIIDRESRLSSRIECGLRQITLATCFTNVEIAARPGATVSFRLHPDRRRFQPSPSPVVVILAASDPTYTAVHCWWLCISGCRMPPLEQSAARRHLSFNADCFWKPPQNFSFSDHFLPNCFRLLVLQTVYSSGLAVFVL